MRATRQYTFDDAICVYLSGSIRKGGSDETRTFWTGSDQAEIASKVETSRIIFLDPTNRADDLSDPWTTFGRDLFQVYCSDFVIVDAREKRGIGVGGEMMFAKLHGIPVISIVSPSSHYMRNGVTYLGQTIDNWTHPFVAGPSDAIVTTPAEAGEWIERHLLHPGRAKDFSSLEDAMSAYVKLRLPKDGPMLSLLEADAIRDIAHQFDERHPARPTLGPPHGQAQQTEAEGATGA